MTDTASHSTISKRLTVAMIGGALFAALVLAGMHGVEKASNGWLAIPFVVALCCVAIGEVLAWHNAACGWHERRLGSMTLWGTLGALLTCGVLYTNYSVGAGNNDGKHAVQLTALTTQGDVGKSIKEAEAAVARLEKSLEMKPKRTPEAARVDQDNAKAHRFWQVTEGCKKTMGPQTRAFCSDYASAVSDESMATAALQTAEELKVEKRKLDDLRSQRAEKRVVASEDQPQILLMANFIPAETPAKALHVARQLDAMVLSFLVQVMLCIGGVCLANEVYRHRKRLPWVDVDKWLQRLALTRDVVTGRRGLPTYRPAESAGTPETHRADAPLMPAWPAAPAPRGNISMLHQTLTDARAAEAAAVAFAGFLPKPQAEAA
jgi:hypothetical protein